MAGAAHLEHRFDHLRRQHLTRGTARDQAATAYAAVDTPDAAAFFGASAEDVAGQEQELSIVAGAVLQRERIAARLEDGFLDATALMEYLIGQGVPPSQTAATPDWFERLTDWRTVENARMLEQLVSLRA